MDTAYYSLRSLVTGRIHVEIEGLGGTYIRVQDQTLKDFAHTAHSYLKIWRGGFGPEISPKFQLISFDGTNLVVKKLPQRSLTRISG